MGQKVGSYFGRSHLTHIRKCQIESFRPGIVHRQPQGVFIYWVLLDAVCRKQSELPDGMIDFRKIMQ